MRPMSAMTNRSDHFRRLMPNRPTKNAGAKAGDRTGWVDGAGARAGGDAVWVASERRGYLRGGFGGCGRDGASRRGRAEVARGADQSAGGDAGGIDRCSAGVCDIEVDLRLPCGERSATVRDSFAPFRGSLPLSPFPSAYALGYSLSSYGLGPANLVAACEEFKGVSYKEGSAVRCGGRPSGFRGWSSASRWGGRGDSSSGNPWRPARAAAIPFWRRPGGC